MSEWPVKQVKNQIMIEREAKDLQRAQACLPGKEINLLVWVQTRRSTPRKFIDLILELASNYNSNVLRLLAFTDDEVIVLMAVGFRRRKLRRLAVHPLAAFGPLNEAGSDNPWFTLGEHEFEAFRPSIDALKTVLPTTRAAQPTAEQNWPQRYDDRSLSPF